MMIQVNSREDGQIYLSRCTRDDFKQFEGITKEVRRDLVVYADIKIGEITITIMRDLDEEDKK